MIDDARDMLDEQKMAYFRTAVREYKGPQAGAARRARSSRSTGDRHTAKAIDDYRKVALELFASWSNNAERPALAQVR